MKKVIITLFLAIFYLINPVYSQNLPIITGDSVNTVQLKAFKGIYNSNKALIIILNEGKVPLNIPPGMLKLTSVTEDPGRAYTLVQTAPGKYATIDFINIDNNDFRLVINGIGETKIFNICFKKKN